MNVLSLFDGMSCGQIALTELGIKVDNYFASEIDKYAMQITQKNYPNTKQIGTVVDVKAENLPKIDLLYGGSPCQGFSIAGKKLNFEDDRSKLFMEFVRLKNELNPKYFLLENVRMKDDIADAIDELLGVKRIFIDSRDFTGHIRKRFYWTNIPVGKIPKTNLKIKDIIDENPFDKDMSFFLDRTPYSPTKSYDGIKLQGVPKDYTDGVSKGQRGKMLGNGWTVGVVKHIFKGLK